jgi:transmembrane sensor
MDANDHRRSVALAAARWFVELDGGELSRREREEFVDWLRESPVHIAEFLRIVRLNGAMARFEQWSEIIAEAGGDSNVVEFRLQRQASRSAPGARARWRIAAGLAASLALVSLIFVARWGGVDQLYIETKRGERRDVVLDDGSTVLMAPGTRLNVRYTVARRDVELQTGRAVFKVAKDADRPFVVSAQTATMRAVGTQFGVEHEAGEIIVTVSEGRVAVKTHGIARNIDANREVLLGANQQITVGAEGTSQPRTVDGRRELSWAQGRLFFENRRIAEILDRFNEYNSVALEVRDAELAERRVSGVFDASDPDAFIAFLGTVANVKVTRSADVVLLERSDSGTPRVP